MAKPIEWKRQAAGSYAWVLGLHYYTEKDGDRRWPVACKVNGSDLWDGGRYMTRHEAERAAQAHFDEQIQRFA